MASISTILGRPRKPSPVERVLNQSLASRTDLKKRRTSGGGSSYTEPKAKKETPIATPKTKQETKAITPALKTQQLKKRVTDLRKQAGTFGRKLSPAEEMRQLKKFTGKQEQLRSENLQPKSIQSINAELQNTEAGAIQRVVKPAPTGIQQYKEFLKDKTKISGSLQFAGEKLQGFVAKKEEKIGGQSLAKSGGVSKVLQTAPYFVPVVGEALLIGVGGEQVGTKTGREQLKQLGVQFEQSTGVPKEIGTVGGGAVAVGGILLGGYSGIKRIESATGFPKYEVQFISRDTKLQNVNNVDLMKSQSMGVIRKRNLLSDDTAVFLAESKTGIQTLPNDEFILLGGTKGVVREIKGYTPTGEAKFSKQPKGFVDVVKGQGKQTQKTVSISQDGITASKDFQGFDYVGGGKSLDLANKETNYFLTKGSGIRAGDKTLLRSKTAPAELSFSGEKFVYPKASRGTQTGISKYVDTQPSVSYMGGKQTTVKTSPDIKALSESQVKTALERQFPTSKPINAPVKVTSKQTPKTQQVDYLGMGSTKTSLDTLDQKPVQLPKQALAVSQNNQKTRNVPKLKTKIKQIEKQQEKLVKILSQPSRIKQTTRQAFMQKVQQLQSQKLKLAQQSAITITPTVQTPKPKPPFSPHPFKPKGSDSQTFTKPKTSKDSFIPEIKRRGKWLPLGKFSSLQRAKIKGLARIKSTLGASLRIKSKGQLINIAKSNKYFRPSKVNPLVLVQRRGQRLSSFPERSEILRSRL